MFGSISRIFSTICHQWPSSTIKYSASMVVCRHPLPISTTSDQSKESSKFRMRVRCAILCGRTPMIFKGGWFPQEEPDSFSESRVFNSSTEPMEYLLSVAHISWSWKGLRRYSQKSWSLFGLLLTTAIGAGMLQPFWKSMSI